jgi:hypothetical protein
MGTDFPMTFQRDSSAQQDTEMAKRFHHCSNTMMDKSCTNSALFDFDTVQEDTEWVLRRHQDNTIPSCMTAWASLDPTDSNTQQYMELV